ncbi:MAG: hypothetical protein EBU43_03990 [Actinobacteria bacterium]|nr:hypothetical protein [Actinomycetota bacterium]
MTVTDPNGKRIDDGSLEVNGSKALVGITTLTSTGVMTVEYQVVGADGVSLSGTSNFQVSAAALATPSATASAVPTPVDTLPPLETSTATHSFWSNLKSGGSGILLGVLLLTVLLSRLARRKRQYTRITRCGHTSRLASSIVEFRLTRHSNSLRRHCTLWRSLFSR